MDNATINLQPKQHFEILDGLRGIAALAVVVFHFMEWAYSDFTTNFIAHGFLAVDFFFCLSGFVIGYAYDDRIAKMGILEFFKSRVIRLHPLVISGSVLGLLAFLFDPFGGHPELYSTGKIVLAFFSSLLMIPMPAIEDRGFNLFSFNAPAWSLFWEYIANIFYAFVLCRVKSGLLLLLTIISAAALCFVAYRSGNLLGGWSGPTFWDGCARISYSFLAGLLVYRSNWIIKNKLGFVGLSVLLFLAFLMPFNTWNWISEPLIVLFYFPLIIALGAGAILNPALKKLCVFSGKISYPLYMTHYAVLWMFGNYYTSHKPGTMQLTFIIIAGLILLVGISYLVMVIYDIPVRKYFTEQRKKGLAKHLLTATVLGFATFSSTTAAAQDKLALPSVAHQEWSDTEIGAIFHFDMPTFVPDYNWRVYGSHPPASVFNPSKVNTDQWIAAAKAGGAKYAVLVAKHGSGFSLWPTAAHAYSVKNSPWKNGKGDLVKDFVESCKKYGVRPGIYASASTNGYLWADNPGVVHKGGPVDQKTYNQIVIQQLTELWTNYGKLFEIWFDGGVIPVREGGPDVDALLKKLQPDAVVFQGPASAKNLIRWIGNEDGLAPYPNWSTTNGIDATKGFKENDFSGIPGGKIWCPGETDFPLRTGGFQGGWFWVDENQDMISKEKFLDNYVTSVGRNSNMLIGIVVDSSGLVPRKDVALLKDFGDAVKVMYRPMATTSGSGKEILLNLGNVQLVKGVVIKEDIAKGERIREYRLEGFNGQSWRTIGGGSSVGHKRIEMLNKPSRLSKIKLILLKAEGTPVIKELGAI